MAHSSLVPGDHRGTRLARGLGTARADVRWRVARWQTGPVAPKASRSAPTRLPRRHQLPRRCWAASCALTGSRQKHRSARPCCGAPCWSTDQDNARRSICWPSAHQRTPTTPEPGECFRAWRCTSSPSWAPGTVTLRTSDSKSATKAQACSAFDPGTSPFSRERTGGGACGVSPPTVVPHLSTYWSLTTADRAIGALTCQRQIRQCGVSTKRPCRHLAAWTPHVVALTQRASDPARVRLLGGGSARCG